MELGDQTVIQQGPHAGIVGAIVGLQRVGVQPHVVDFVTVQSDGEGHSLFVTVPSRALAVPSADGPFTVHICRHAECRDAGEGVCLEAVLMAG